VAASAVNRLPVMMSMPTVAVTAAVGPVIAHVPRSVVAVVHLRTVVAIAVMVVAVLVRVQHSTDRSAHYRPTKHIG